MKYRLPGRELTFDRPLRVILPWPKALGSFNVNLTQSELLAWAQQSLECPGGVWISEVVPKHSRTKGATLAISLTREGATGLDRTPRTLIAIPTMYRKKDRMAARQAAEDLLALVPEGTLTELVNGCADLVRETIIGRELAKARGNRSEAARALGVTDERIAVMLRLYPWIADEWPARHGRPSKKSRGKT